MINLHLRYTPAQIQIFFPAKETKYNIIPKGRRFGATKGMANACIEWASDGITPILWGDTVNSNIDRYFERYFEPELKRAKIPHQFNKQKRQLKIFESVIDFRSADIPENWEGFGYKKILLNEAGIILKNNYLYTNAVLPMLLDFEDSQLYAIGTPKGKIKKDGMEHLFYVLAKKAIANVDGNYRYLKFSSYDNPLLKAADIESLEQEISLMDKHQVAQEIYGDFIENETQNPFAINYNPEIHESKLVQRYSDKPIFVSMDFNLQPMAIIFSHKWVDREGYHSHYFDEISIDNANIEKAADYILENYRYQLPTMLFTGDSMGKKRDIGQVDHSSLYIQLQRKLKIKDNQFWLPPNPLHTNSRNDCNYVLKYHPDIKFNPEKCKLLTRDLRNVQVDAYGSIIKQNRKDANQRADFLDCFVGETLIITESGNKRIDEINIGEFVKTQNGYNKVIDSWSSYADVYEFEFNNGDKIICTKDHKFYNDLFGWYKIFSIFAEKLNIWKIKSYTTEEVTQNIQSKNIIIAPTKNNIQDVCTGKNGSTISEKYQKDMLCTTKTATPLITKLKTTNLSKEGNIKDYTLIKELRKILNFLLSFRKKEFWLLLFGTVQNKVLSGIRNTQKKLTLETLTMDLTIANNVKKNTIEKQKEQDFVGTTANPLGEEKTNPIYKKEIVKDVVPNLQLLNITQNDFAQKNANLLQTHTAIKVQKVTFLGKQKVFDITVENEHNFYANGYLVHNCFRYDVNSFLHEWKEKHQRNIPPKNNTQEIINKKVAEIRNSFVTSHRF